MLRRTMGVLLLLAASLAVLTGGSLTGHTVQSTAVRTPLLSPPPVGSCLRLVGDMWFVSDCAEPHTVEIARTWPAAQVPTIDLYDSCVAAAAAYLGSSAVMLPDSVWVRPPLMHTQMVLAGPTPAVADGWSGRACAVRPIVAGLPAEGYRGRTMASAQSRTTPIDIRTCYNRPDERAGLVDVSCRAGHVGQILAVRMLRLPQPNEIRDEDPAVEEQCQHIAESSTEIVGSVPARSLSVIVYLNATGMGSITSSTSSTTAGGLSADYTLYEASCSVQAVPTA